MCRVPSHAELIPARVQKNRLAGSQIASRIASMMPVNPSNPGRGIGSVRR